MNGRTVQRFCLALMACLALATCSKNNDTGTPVPPTGIVVLRLNGTTGALDPAFAPPNGIVVIDPDAGQFDFANAVALQPDGKILSAGRTVFQGLNSIFLMRQLANGSLDTSFANGTGIAKTPIPGNSTGASAIAVQGDGKILVAAISFNQGSVQTSITLARYNANGIPDTAFGGGGTGIVSAALGPGQDSDTCGLALQADGKIVVAGASTITSPVTSANGKIFLYRYDSAGVLDPSFGSGGTVTTDLLANPMSPAIALQADGKIVLAGGKGSFNGTSSPVDEVVLRYNTDGTPDINFGTAGIVVTDIGALGNFASALLIQADGRIVTAGHAFVDFGADASDISLIRYKTDGTLDQAFGTAGIALTNLGGFDNALSIALQPHVTGDQFIVSGNSGSHGLSGVAVLRYNADGSPDSTFGNGGVAAPPLVGPSITASGNGVVVQPDGNIVVAGFD